MGYRIVEITKPSECHVSNGQLVVEQEEGTVQIPVEDSKKSDSCRGFKEKLHKTSKQNTIISTTYWRSKNADFDRKTV